MIHFLSQSLLKIFAVLKFFGKWLQKIIFFKHYQISHRHYLKRKYKNNWQKLTDYISYMLILEDDYCNDTFPISKLYLKPSKFNTNDILEVNLSFIAISGEVHYVQNITHYFD